ncbi:hypothetical protein IEN85_08235 [Pelagicoccus sp. NFK12]|uniref:DUF4019 domain-containing protein n=1 Tax=Pelagicoccus enzymogenes TaxID=2773457 RepID=A0A927F972_9BACT|nr:hypothetical protein [Pelagicoccus enzymogenes]MBD5779480.1 hypothetical protein [Pelagicoccus enzymogenes]
MSPSKLLFIPLFLVSPSLWAEQTEFTPDDMIAEFETHQDQLLSLAGFVGELKDDLLNSDWEAIYEKLSPFYRSNITKDYFLREVGKENPTIEEIQFRKTRGFKKGGYSVYVCAATLGETEGVYMDTLFFSKDEDGTWYLETFPFSKSSALEFGGVIPKGLEQGIRSIN